MLFPGGQQSPSSPSAAHAGKELHDWSCCPTIENVGIALGWGEIVGACVMVGDGEGASEGASDGAGEMVGDGEGASDGAADGAGETVGAGEIVRAGEGASDGCVVGAGGTVGELVGAVSPPVGAKVLGETRAGRLT